MCGSQMWVFGGAEVGLRDVYTSCEEALRMDLRSMFKGFPGFMDARRKYEGMLCDSHLVAHGLRHHLLALLVVASAACSSPAFCPCPNEKADGRVEEP